MNQREVLRAALGCAAVVMEAGAYWLLSNQAVWTLSSPGLLLALSAPLVGHVAVNSKKRKVGLYTTRRRGL